MRHRMRRRIRDRTRRWTWRRPKRPTRRCTKSYTNESVRLDPQHHDSSFSAIEPAPRAPPAQERSASGRRIRRSSSHDGSSFSPEAPVCSRHRVSRVSPRESEESNPTPGTTACGWRTHRRCRRCRATRAIAPSTSRSSGAATPACRAPTTRSSFGRTGRWSFSNPTGSHRVPARGTRAPSTQSTWVSPTRTCPNAGWTACAHSSRRKRWSAISLRPSTLMLLPSKRGAESARDDLEPGREVRSCRRTRGEDRHLLLRRSRGLPELLQGARRQTRGWPRSGSAARRGGTLRRVPCAVPFERESPLASSRLAASFAPTTSSSRPTRTRRASGSSRAPCSPSTNTVSLLAS